MKQAIIKLFFFKLKTKQFYPFLSFLILTSLGIWILNNGTVAATTSDTYLIVGKSKLNQIKIS